MLATYVATAIMISETMFKKQSKTIASAILQYGLHNLPLQTRKTRKKEKSARSDEGLRVPMMDAAFPL